MDTWLTPALVIASLVLGGLATYGFIRFREFIFLKGVRMGETRLRLALGIPDPDEIVVQQQSKLSAKIRTPASLVFGRYELLFDLDIAGYLSSGVAAQSWIPLVERIRELVDQKFDEFPVGTNTVIVRSIQVHKSGEGEFIFEPLYNRELDSTVPIGDEHAG